MQHESLEEFLDGNYDTQQPPTPTFSNTQGSLGGQSGASKSKKRARNFDDVIENLTNAMEKLRSFYEDTKDNVKELASCFKHEKDGAERRMRVIDELKLVDRLTNIQRMMASEIITKDQHRIDYFFTLPVN